MPVNKDLFKKIYEQITRYPETHNQGSWSDHPQDAPPGVDHGSCGTTRCVAGWALHFHAPSRSIFETAREIEPDGHGEPFGPAAALLGLDRDAAEGLFLHSSNADAIRLVREYAGIEDA